MNLIGHDGRTDGRDGRTDTQTTLVRVVCGAGRPPARYAR
jgi:hypothetical protein